MTSPRSQPPSPEIVFEDTDLLVIDKPAGLLTSTVERERRPTALAMAVAHYAGNRRVRVGLVHRLDRDVSGLLVFAKNQRAFSSLKQQFFHHSAGRVYLAIVSPPPSRDAGKIESSLVEWADGSVHSTRAYGRGQRAVTEFQTLEKDGQFAAVQVTLQTGRKHQIRAHLSESGCPVVGDSMYGGPNHASGLMLAAVRLQLDHPRTSKRMTFHADAPARMLPLLKRLKIPADAIGSADLERRGLGHGQSQGLAGRGKGVRPERRQHKGQQR